MPTLIIPVVVAIAVLIILASGYVKASPDTALIISGLRKNPKVLIGKAGVKIPFLERKDELNLQLIPIDVKTSNAVPTADYININVDATVNVKISDDPQKLRLAAQNFLNKKPEYIAHVAREVLEGNVREIVEADEDFHDVIYRATDNPKLENIVNNLREQMYRYRYEYVKDNAVYEQLIEEHSMIMEGLRRKDQEYVKAIMHTHLNNQVEAVRDVIRRYNEEQ